jgi:hypothetical protein
MATTSYRSAAGVLLALGALGLWGAGAEAQRYGDRIGQRRGGEITFEPRGSGVLFDALDPAVKRWYVPQELLFDYGFNTWQYSNYARELYKRYVDTALEGEYFYDIYGNFVTRGWLIYDWRQEALTPLGSSIFQDQRYQGWFNRVLIAADAKGGTHYAITVGDQIRTVLTPMTFSKPTFDGIQLDFSSDKYAATLLLSRASGPVTGTLLKPDSRTNATNMLGGRATAQVGDFVTVGATWVNAHNSRSTLGSFDGNPVKGTLGEGQARVPITAIAVVLSDDSPEDGEGGAALFAHDIAVIREDFQNGARQTFTLADLTRDPTRWPIIEGGFQEEGYLAANGAQQIILNYDFTDPSYVGPDPTEIVEVRFDMVLANDYRVQVWSDRQTGERTVPEAPLTREILEQADPVLLEVARARDNVKDGSNRRRVSFEYGLPMAEQIYGFTIEAHNLMGFNLYGEYDINQRYRQYPNLALFTDDRTFEGSSSRADAWMLNLSFTRQPWFFLGEAFSMEPGYSTSPFIVNVNGDVLYDRDTAFRYEFVDDNDDQDRNPDWQRVNQPGPDFLVFPGWDENNDFVSDFNQNDNRTISNRVPDYDEPFLRYNVDHPDFLFGIDLNNNGWIDRFENDDEPDFPYKRDHRGYNAYLGRDLAPGVRLTAGRTREGLISSHRENRTNYGLFTLDQDFPGLGRLRVFNMLKRAEDDVPDVRREPQAFLEAGPPPVVPDLLPAQDTWINSLFVGFDYASIPNLRWRNKLKYEFYAQNGDDPRALDRSPLRERATLFGLINKVDYSYRVGAVKLQPRFKSQYLRRSPYLARQDKVREWTGLWSVVCGLPMLKSSQLEFGAEYLQLRDLVLDEKARVRDALLGPTGDLNESNAAVQWSTTTAYMGYRLTVQGGFRFTRRSVERVEMMDLEVSKGAETETSSATFITIYAGGEQ